MGIVSELLATVRDLGALEKRSEDVLRAVEKLTAKIDSLSDRVTKLEMEQKHLRDGVKSEILSDIKADFVRIQSRLDHLKENKREGQAKLTDG